MISDTIPVLYERRPRKITWNGFKKWTLNWLYQNPSLSAFCFHFHLSQPTNWFIKHSSFVRVSGNKIKTFLEERGQNNLMEPGTLGSFSSFCMSCLGFVCGGRVVVCKIRFGQSFGNFNFMQRLMNILYCSFERTGHPHTSLLWEWLLKTFRRGVHWRWLRGRSGWANSS